ncbi:energy-coupling factor ABC transporter ATP-binding protein [Vibrio sonorensis]|uniref:energy-coupling factor ABC transporter ATP-binding protein n=1 Tax=Vibrio sonorensis TaxID=1004316 RepID=UPI0008D970B6|nr:energy-coupling factor ABC transporter ATP-binding protein [Vibrio sonorensis]
MTIQITAQQLSMRYKERVLFHIPNLSIGPNDAIYLSGDNGVGKTTLLKILAGLIKPSTGKVNASHDSWLQTLWARRGRTDVVYLHQSPYLFDGSVYDNVVYGIKYDSNDSKLQRNSVITALRMVGLETLADEHISVLSGGERQRVAMARAWVIKPSILLMDEPSASLDIESIKRIVVMAKDLLDRGASIVITSHQKNELTNLCHKRWLIENATLVESPLLQVIPETAHEQEYVTSNAN